MKIVWNGPCSMVKGKNDASETVWRIWKGDAYLGHYVDDMVFKTKELALAYALEHGYARIEGYEG